MKRLTFRGLARRDLAEARVWYRKHGLDLARRFVDRVNDGLDAICRSPTTYSKVFRDVRVFLVREFPYAIYYRDEPSRVRVIAVMHTSRDPEAWRSRYDDPA